MTGVLERGVIKKRVVLKSAGEKYLVRYAPVASDAAAKLVLSLAALRRWKREQRDVVGAYLNAAIDNCVIFMKQPTGHGFFGPGGEEFVCVLNQNQALYGLRQAGHLWHEGFSEDLKELGLKPLPVEPFAYTNDTLTIFVIIYAVASGCPRSRAAVLFTDLCDLWSGWSILKFWVVWHEAATLPMVAQASQ